MKQIHTREQLEAEIEKIMDEEVMIEILSGDCEDVELNYGESVRKICDLIADLPNMCFHETNK